MAFQLPTFTAAQVSAGATTVPALTSAGAMVDGAGTSIRFRPSPLVATPTFAPTMTLDATLGDVFDITLTGNLTLDLMNGVNGQVIEARLKQDATGSRLVNWGTSIAFGGDITSVMVTASVAPNTVDLYWFQYDAASSKYRMIRFARGY